MTSSNPGCAALVLFTLAVAACSRPNPLFGVDVAGTGGPSDSDGGKADDDGGDDAGEDPDGSTGRTSMDPPGDDDDGDDDDEDDGSGGEGPGDSETGSACGLPADAGAYVPCERNACPADGACFAGGTPAPVLYSYSVCQPACVDACDCPGFPAGDAAPACEAGHCMLDCEVGGCPPGMRCEDGQCAWPDAYGPCGAGCDVGRCVTSEEGDVCPTLDCWEDGALPDALCPPPRTGNATPLCFEPQAPPKFNGEGWCVLTCSPATDCPEGMICSAGGLCLHP